MNYLYNGIKSLDINTVYTPELQAEYPYAVLFNRPNYDSYITLIISKKPCYITYSYLLLGMGHNNLNWDVNNGFLEFRDLVIQEGGPFFDFGQNIDDVGAVWSNHNIYYADDYQSHYFDGFPSEEPDPLAGTLYLAASDPVPVSAIEPIDPKSLTAGWRVGQLIAGLRGKTPVAYFYGHVAGEGETPTHTINGVGYVGAVLPKLPEWDREMYPYALLSHYEWLGDTYTALLVVYSEKAETGYNDDGELADWVQIKNPRIEFAMVYPRNGAPNEWGEPSEFNTGESANRSGIWSNTDIYLDNGNLYLAASEPVPVYE